MAQIVEPKGQGPNHGLFLDHLSASWHVDTTFRSNVGQGNGRSFSTPDQYLSGGICEFVQPTAYELKEQMEGVAWAPVQHTMPQAQQLFGTLAGIREQTQSPSYSSFAQANMDLDTLR